jgi:hypothetical protein
VDWRARAEAAETRLAELENAVTWGTSCLSCSRVLDSAHAETVRAEGAGRKLAEVRAFLDRASAEFNERNDVTREVPAGTPVMVRALDIAAIIGAEAETEPGP